MMKPSACILGIDVGSVSIHVAVLTQKDEILYSAGRPHHGEIRDCLCRLLADVDMSAVSYIAATDGSPATIDAHKFYDDQLTLIRAARFFHKDFDALLHIGGERFSLSRFDDNQRYAGAKHNTSCAAGTGSFLDQQARRLNLAGGSAELSQKALHNNRDIPEIATRCAVFAKTDLIHAQQEGYSLEQICDGLCLGLAKNIANTLFKFSHVGQKIVFCGGVARNPAVRKHLEAVTECGFIIDSHSSEYGAVGAAICLMDDLLTGQNVKEKTISSPTKIFTDVAQKDHLMYPPLALKLSQYPDFKCFSTYVEDGVEVDIYDDPTSLSIDSGYLGLDVGSTSTKAILTDPSGTPVVGFYTRTASRPVMAIQKIFKVCETFFNAYGISMDIRGCGTTGSGRRLAGRIIGADIEPDEITAHATAACRLNPDVDTIIEIGGQDAKFTLLRNGRVTASVMNTVCAAGTGSFIEEQALKLGCPLSEYSAQAEGVPSPVTSDRCTVFMERDINYFFARGFRKNEILAAVLHSVRDNYLTKVANAAQIGRCVLFQGATAKNKALVAAFEQKLNQPIQVSRYCHLTGALGVALMVHEKQVEASLFRGFGLWQKNIPVRQETCDICTNHCKLTLAEIDGETLAYGFLCGRDYHTPRKIPLKNHYSILKARQQAGPKMEKKPVRHDFTIGIPKALHLYEDTDTWVCFFSHLGIRTITSENLKDPIQLGKKSAKAEFCAPVVALHGHVRYLMDRADFVFLPFYFEESTGEKDCRRQHCYYTQFSPSVIACLPELDRDRILSPIVRYLYTQFHTKLELYKMLKTLSPDFRFSFLDISTAYDQAMEYGRARLKAIKSLFEKHRPAGSRVHVLLLGRPYTVMSPVMNHRIPQLFENLGIKVFFQDMLDIETLDCSPIEPLLKEIHWHHVARILKAAYIAAVTDGLYPVYISSFKCSPDAFGKDYFKMIMEDSNKPYLILELDEHDSSVGYETRVEAAVRSFTNHSEQARALPLPEKKLAAMDPGFLTKIGQKTILFPNWDILTGRLIVSIFRNEGHDAFLLEETPDTLKQCILTNTGQCIPLNAVAASFIHTVGKHGLDPENCLLWLNPSEIACNIKLYPYHIKKILERHGNGFERAEIYKGELSLFDISFKASVNTYFAYMFGGLLRSMGCRIRPYEIRKGETDQVLAQSLDILCRTFEANADKEAALQTIMEMFLNIRTRTGQKPKVGIFGDLYVRDNDVINQDLIRYIEDQGGEVITTPYYKYVKIIAHSYFRKWFKEGKYMSLISNKTLFLVMQAMEKKYYKYFEPILSRSALIIKDSQETILTDYGVLREHTGESMDNILKIHHIISEHPDLKLLVQANPAFCCPGLITEAMAHQLEARLNVPIVSITYDISGGNKNKVILPFLKDSADRRYFHNLKMSV